MSILAVLVVLHNAHLDNHSLQHVPRIGIILIILAIRLINLIKRITLIIMFMVRVITVPVHNCPPTHTCRSAFRLPRVIAHPPAVSTADTLQWHIDPAAWSVAFPSCELDEVVATHPGGENHLRRRVTLVELEIEVYADTHDGYQFEEVEG